MICIDAKSLILLNVVFSVSICDYNEHLINGIRNIESKYFKHIHIATVHIQAAMKPAIKYSLFFNTNIEASKSPATIKEVNALNILQGLEKSRPHSVIVYDSSQNSSIWLRDLNESFGITVLSSYKKSLIEFASYLCNKRGSTRQSYLIFIDVIQGKYFRTIDLIMKKLTKCDIYKVIIVYNNEVNSSLDVYMHTYIHPPTVNCKHPYNIVLMDQWVVIDEGYFVRNVSLDQDRISYNFGNCSVKVSAVSYEPHVMHSDSNDDGVFDDGFEILLLKFALQKLNASISFLPVPKSLWGLKLKNGTWTGILGNVFEKRADIAICGLMLLLKRVADFDFVWPIDTSNFYWVVPCAKPYPPWSSILRVYHPYTWIFIFSMVLMVSAVMLQMSKYQEEVFLKNISNYLLDSWAMLLGSGVNKPPLSLSLRLCFFTCMGYSWAINIIFQSFVTSYIVNPGLQNQINSLNSLLASGLDYGYHPDIDYFFEDDGNILLKEIVSRRQECYNIQNCLERVVQEGDFVTISSYESIQYKNTYKYIDESGRGLLCTIKDPAFVSYKTFYLAPGSSLRYSLNKYINVAIESGFTRYWWKYIFVRSLIKTASKRIRTLKDDYSVFLVRHLQGVFYMLLFGYILSFIAFSCEIFQHWLLRNKLRSFSKL
ncbi:Ionotropic receptor 219 [Blattella germanica]|nr:Ionotropic receptor 219 [Blattella germanica]